MDILRIKIATCLVTDIHDKLVEERFDWEDKCTAVLMVLCMSSSRGGGGVHTLCYKRVVGGVGRGVS